jgi:hypothetical protein
MGDVATGIQQEPLRQDVSSRCFNLNSFSAIYAHVCWFEVRQLWKGWRGAPKYHLANNRCPRAGKSCNGSSNSRIWETRPFLGEAMSTGWVPKLVPIDRCQCHRSAYGLRNHPWQGSNARIPQEVVPFPCHSIFNGHLKTSVRLGLWQRCLYSHSVRICAPDRAVG